MSLNFLLLDVFYLVGNQSSQLDDVFFFGTSLRTKEALAAKDVRALDLRPVTDLGAPNIGKLAFFLRRMLVL